MFFLLAVVNCALRFYNSSTVIAGRKDQPTVKKQITKTLNVTTNPEEKRKIIGDTFIKVRIEGLYWQVLEENKKWMENCNPGENCIFNFLVHI